MILTSSLSVSAKEMEIHKGKISIDKVSAVTGDTIIVPIRITENPGLMATTISITYDSEALELNYYYKGNILRDYTVVPHPDKNIIRFVNCESADKTSDGVLVNLQFLVKETASAGFHEMTIQYSSGDFCNWDLDRIMPEIIPGGVDVAFNGKNCLHKIYGEWTVAAEPTCNEKGIDQRICKACGHVEIRETEPHQHKYSDKWTIDRPATEWQEGIMTRYCIWCSDYTDRITYTLEQSTQGGFNNNENAENTHNDYINNIFKDQNPDKELAQNKPLKNKKPSQNKPEENKKPEENTPSTDIPDIPTISETENNAITLKDVFKTIGDAFKNFNAMREVFETALILLVILVL